MIKLVEWLERYALPRWARQRRYDNIVAKQSMGRQAIQWLREYYRL